MKIQDFDPKALRLAIGADHGGFELKEQLVADLRAAGIEVLDKGPAVMDPADDYPVYGAAVAEAIVRGEADCGILVCRSGAGMGIVANRFHGVRAVVASGKDIAVKSREHNASNVLVLSGDNMTAAEAKDVVTAWINTPFSGDDRHARRLTQAEQRTYDDIAALRNADPEIAAWIDKEAARQNDGIELIASENFTSCAVRAAQGSILTNKYAEGYPGKRYYGGCEFVDEIETIAIERAKALFGAGNGENAPVAELGDEDFTDGVIDVLTLFAKSGLVASKSEARRTVEQGGAVVDGEKVTDIKATFEKVE